MAGKANDCWEAEFPVATLGRNSYTVQGSGDRSNTWRCDLQKRIAAGRGLSVELPIVAELIQLAAARAGREDAQRLRHWAESLRAGDRGMAESGDLLAAIRLFVCNFCNFTPIRRRIYRVGSARGGFWKEVLNSGAPLYRSSGQGNMVGVPASPLPRHQRPWSLSITAPPLGLVVFRAGPE
jgi:hypothetical protein